MKKIIYIIVFSMGVFSCKTENKVTENPNELKLDLDSALEELRLNFSVSHIDSSLDTLAIDLLYEPNPMNEENDRFFLHLNSREVLFGYINTRINIDLIRDRVLVYKIVNSPEIPPYICVPADVDTTLIFYNKHPLYESNVKLSINEFGYKNVLKSEQYIKYLYENANDIFNYNGDYWTLLKRFSLANENGHKNFKTVYHFIIFTSLSKDDENPDPRIDINKDFLKKIIEQGGYDSHLVELDAYSLMIALEAMVDPPLPHE